MKAQEKAMMVLAILVAFMALAVFLPSHMSAGDLEPTDPPGSTMHTLEEIYGVVSANSDKLDEVSTLQIVNVDSNYGVSEFDDVIVVNNSGVLEPIEVSFSPPDYYINPKVIVVTKISPDNSHEVRVVTSSCYALFEEGATITFLVDPSNYEYYVISKVGVVNCPP